MTKVLLRYRINRKLHLKLAEIDESLFTKTGKCFFDPDVKIVFEIIALHEKM